VPACSALTMFEWILPLLVIKASMVWLTPQMNSPHTPIITPVHKFVQVFVLPPSYCFVIVSQFFSMMVVAMVFVMFLFFLTQFFVQDSKQSFLTFSACNGWVNRIVPILTFFSTVQFCIVARTFWNVCLIDKTAKAIPHSPFVPHSQTILGLCFCISPAFWFNHGT